MKDRSEIYYNPTSIKRYLTKDQYQELRNHIIVSGINLYPSAPDRHLSGKPKFHKLTDIIQSLTSTAFNPAILTILTAILDNTATSLPQHRIQRPRKKHAVPPRSDHGVPNRLKVRREEIEPLKDHLNCFYEIVKKSESAEYAKQYLKELKEYISRHRDFQS